MSISLRSTAVLPSAAMVTGVTGVNSQTVLPGQTGGIADRFVGAPASAPVLSTIIAVPHSARLAADNTHPIRLAAGDKSVTAVPKVVTRVKLPVRAPTSAPAPESAAPAEASTPVAVTEAPVADGVAYVSELIMGVIEYFSQGKLSEKLRTQLKQKIPVSLNEVWSDANAGPNEKLRRIVGILASVIQGLPQAMMGIAAAILHFHDQQLPVEEAKSVLIGQLREAGLVPGEAPVDTPASHGASSAVGSSATAGATGKSAAAETKPEFLALEAVRSATTSQTEHVLKPRERKLTLSLANNLSVELFRDPDNREAGVTVRFYVYPVDSPEFNRMLQEDIAVIHQDMVVTQHLKVTQNEKLPIRVEIRLDFVKGVTKTDAEGLVPVEVFYKGQLYLFRLSLDSPRMGF